MTTTPRPGWYPDPADGDGPGYRWWDGSSWTDDVADHAYAPSPADAVPSTPRRRSRSMQVVAWTVVIALVLTTSAGALLLLWSGPAPTRQPDPENASAVGGKLDERARRATIGPVTLDLPGQPYRVSSGTHKVTGVLDTVFVAEAPVHPRTVDHDGWSAMVCLAAVNDHLAADFDLDADSATTLHRLAGVLYGTGHTQVTGLDLAEHAVDGHPGVRITAQVHYRIDGLPSQYDDVTAIVVRLDDGSVVTALSSVPNDASDQVRDLAAQSLDSLTIN